MPEAPSSGGATAFVALAGVAGVLRVWFRAEDRWRRRRLLRAARRKRARRTLHAT